MAAGRHDWVIEEILADLASQRGIEGREERERGLVPICRVEQGVVLGHDCDL